MHTLLTEREKEIKPCTTAISTYIFIQNTVCMLCLYVYLCPALRSHMCMYDYACLSRSSPTVAVSVWLVTLQLVQVSALTRTTVTGCSHTSWLSLSSLPLSSPSGGHQATCSLSGQI